ncbi:hypothetical protein BVRB_8g181480 [Beta vulgaris subsp. vulgaris]|nr:hypothetical protein BVRB_8g181480 [Beta vulgaris subsp. vulgaris]
MEHEIQLENINLPLSAINCDINIIRPSTHNKNARSYSSSTCTSS